jgi:type III restriction enzyme
MKLKYDAELGYQRLAIEAVVDAFSGQPLVDSHFSVSIASQEFMGVTQTEIGLANRLVLTDAQLLENVRHIQENNGIPKVSDLQGRHFSIEMETGTGKTYVYLRTIFELNKTYGWTKFIIVVPSVAIREGVLSSITLMRDHFATLYSTPFDALQYDSKALGKIRQFATANTLQILVINIQAFQKDAKDENSLDDTDSIKKINVINRESDRLSGKKPIEFIQASRPIVILDEPQSVEGDTLQGETLSSRAIARLTPLFTLRYSATHKNYHNLLYKLDPIQAFEQKLVKQVEVASIRAEDNLNDAFVKLLAVDNKKCLRAKLQINVQEKEKATQKAIWVKMNDDLYVKSKERQEYKNGYIVQNILFTPGCEAIEFSNGQYLELGKALAGFDDDMMRAQVRETIEQHLMKERLFKGKGIKVLSLFFLDRVDNYRIYNPDGTISLGKIGRWFEEELSSLIKKPQYQGLVTEPVEKLHNGYFSRDKKGGYKDTTGTTKEDDDTYHLIMRDKERLLSLDEPLRFIFSHSALREGWDNPNVFQICTLNESKSYDRKRQEIGRGLRLPVNQQGERIRDESINRLTVIANESYEHFAKTLQNEYEADYGIRFSAVPKEKFAGLAYPVNGSEQMITRKITQEQSQEIWQHLHHHGYLDGQGRVENLFDPKNPHFVLSVPEEFIAVRANITDIVNRYVFKNRIVNQRDRKLIKLNKQVFLDTDFAELWKRISQKTRYRVKFSTEELVRIASQRIQIMPTISSLKIEMDKVMLLPTLAGVEVNQILENRTTYVALNNNHLPDILAYLQNATDLTRRTLVEILLQSDRLEDFSKNPQAFMSAVTHELKMTLQDLMLKGIVYQKVDGQYWEMHKFEEKEELQRYLNNLYEVQHQHKSLYNYVECDSEVERNFARDLDSNQHIKLFVKLPHWFTVDTPLGSYNPDWAIVLKQDEQVYLVRETKGSIVEGELRYKEQDKLFCGRKHFDAINVNFDVVTNLKEIFS